MDSNSSNIIPTSYYISSDKVYTSNEKSYKISNIVNKFDADAFANWFKPCYLQGKKDSRYGSYKELAEKVGSNEATLNRLANAADQSITQKPSQPGKDLVIKLAEFYGADVDKTLVLAGHAPKNGSQFPEPIVAALSKPGDLSEKSVQAVAALINVLRDLDMQEKEYKDYVIEKESPRNVVPFRQSDYHDYQEGSTHFKADDEPEIVNIGSDPPDGQADPFLDAIIEKMEKEKKEND